MFMGITFKGATLGRREGGSNNSPKSLVQTAKRTSVSLHGRQGAGEKGSELAKD